jgi:hypothetical protein
MLAVSPSRPEANRPALPAVNGGVGGHSDDDAGGGVDQVRQPNDLILAHIYLHLISSGDAELQPPGAYGLEEGMVSPLRSEKAHARWGLRLNAEAKQADTAGPDDLLEPREPILHIPS